MTYTQTALPHLHCNVVPVELNDVTIHERKKKILKKMECEGYDTLLIYGDREHGSNFSYLMGFTPRFEEALLVLQKDGSASVMLGNEMLRMADYSRIAVKAIHTPHFSLPDQPMETTKSFQELLKEAGVNSGKTVGIVGWKLQNDQYDPENQMFDVPYFIVQAVMEVVGQEYVRNGTGLFVRAFDGVRTLVNANEIAFYEYGSSLASVGVGMLLEKLEIGKTELELAGYLENCGQPNTVQTICASGHRFTKGCVAPRNKNLSKGERFTMTVGYRGGLTNRTGYLAFSEDDLPESEKDYMEKVAIPYFSAMASWYSSVGIGIRGGEIYRLMEEIIPKEMFGWSLNPGHYTSDEEWVSSPFKPDSEIVLNSGMLLQMDIILKVSGYGGCNAEDGVVLMDEILQRQVEKNYPSTWHRLVQRKRYMKDVLGIVMKDEVFPMSDLCGYVRPFLLERTKALQVRKQAIGV